MFGKNKELKTRIEQLEKKVDDVWKFTESLLGALKEIPHVVVALRSRSWEPTKEEAHDIKEGGFELIEKIDAGFGNILYIWRKKDGQQKNIQHR